MWNKCSDVLPPVNDLVLVFLPAEELEFAIWLGYWDGSVWRSDDSIPFEPSHWMKLPEGPQ